MTAVPLPKGGTPEEWRERYLGLAVPLLRMKLSGAKHHHLLPAEKPPRFKSRVALCGAGIDISLLKSVKNKTWTRVVGEDDCCNQCQSLASRGRYFVRPYRPTQAGAPRPRFKGGAT